MCILHELRDPFARFFQTEHGKTRLRSRTRCSPRIPPPARGGIDRRAAPKMHARLVRNMGGLLATSIDVVDYSRMLLRPRAAWNRAGDYVPIVVSPRIRPSSRLYMAAQRSRPEREGGSTGCREVDQVSDSNFSGRTVSRLWRRGRGNVDFLVFPPKPQRVVRSSSPIQANKRSRVCLQDT